MLNLIKIFHLLFKGRVYALQLEGIWYRVLVENKTVFYVDIGRRDLVQTKMGFHFLPNRFSYSKLNLVHLILHFFNRRFLKLKAQALKCTLFGVAPISMDRICRYPKGIDPTLSKYVNAHAVVIFWDLKAGTVGFSHEGSKELCAQVTL